MFKLQEFCFSHKIKPHLIEGGQLNLQSNKIGDFEKDALNLLLLTRSCGIPALDHEILNDPVEFGVVIVSSAGQLSKVPTGVGGVFPVELQHHLTHPVKARTRTDKH